MFNPRTTKRLSRHRTPWHLVALIFLIALSCSDSSADDAVASTDDSAAATESASPPPSSTAPDQPNAAAFNLYLGEELGLIDHAVDRAVAKCMAEVGYRQLLENVAASPERAFEELVITLATFGPVSEEAARRDGLGQQPRAAPASIISNDTSFDAALEACREEIWNEFGAEAQDTYSSYFELGNQLYSGFIARYPSEPIRDLYRAWLGCIADSGFPADDPEAFVEDFDPSRFGITTGSVVAETQGGQPTYEPGTIEVLAPATGERYEPTEDEIAFAVADFKCRESTGFNAQILGFVQEIEATIVADQEAVLAELNPTIEELARRAVTLSGNDE